jgi:anthranilate phosphoribosyltransferase
MKNILIKLSKQQDLTPLEMTSAMEIILLENVEDGPIAAFLMGLQAKGETHEELSAAVKVLRKLADKITLDYPVVDIVGTGGDHSSSFNISTAASFVVAASGGKVAKHGNRSVSSQSGAADLLQAAASSTDGKITILKKTIRFSFSL